MIFSPHRVILDVLWRWTGRFCVHLAPRAAKARLMLFRSAAGCGAGGGKNFAAAGLGDRAVAYPGDVGADALPAGADLITLIRVLHDNDDDRALRILSAARAALAPGGKILVAEPMSAAGAADPIADAYFGFYLLAMRSGRPRSPAELTNLLKAAGFSNIRPRATGQPMLTRILTADL